MLVCINYRQITAFSDLMRNIFVAFLPGITFANILVALLLVSTITIINSIIRSTITVGLTFAVTRVSSTCIIEFATPSFLLNNPGCVIDVINSFYTFIIEFLDEDGIELIMACNGVLTLYLPMIFKIIFIFKPKQSKKLLYRIL
ncbi:hypothetical protein DMUE_3058 [Dictyocoela muelleri]|nr:hypothetical protein DMUE_3058 [Dictyocoela muelleri]